MDDQDDDSSNRIYNRYSLTRLSMTSPTTLIVQWNVSYFPPTAQWLLLSLANTMGWTVEPKAYNDKFGDIRKFSYRAVFQLFADAIATQRLRVPLACIQGTTICEFGKKKATEQQQEQQRPSSSTTMPKIISITEDLAYAQELQRGVLQNRVCAQDLQAFLESARRPLEQSPQDWQDAVAGLLPWTSVPGMLDPLAIEPMDDADEGERLIPLFFLGGVTLFLLGFAYVLAPELVGQS
ncbi:MAG: hypothetical protein SGILL_005757, partial [Bacillariaceae sp.]